MDLSEIEAKADQLAQKLADPDISRTRAELLGIRLQGLAHAAQIKSTVAFRKERESQPLIQYPAAPINGPCGHRAPTHRLIGCTLPAGHLGGHTDGELTWSGPEPTKPAVDRLHELVSMWRGFSRGQDAKADAVLASPEQLGYHNGQAVGWGKAASMLEEILSEGGI